jgi:hypothetical protein
MDYVKAIRRGKLPTRKWRTGSHQPTLFDVAAPLLPGMPRPTDSAIRNTINLLKHRQALRAAGEFVSLNNDPSWLVNMAINRRAGWPDDPTHTRGSAMPTTDGRYPPRAYGDQFIELWRLARDFERRVVVRIDSINWRLRKRLMARIPHRITTKDEE